MPPVDELEMGVAHKRMIEALLFSAPEPLSADDLSALLPEGSDIAGQLAALMADYKDRGVNLVAVAGKYQFRTAPDLAFLLKREVEETRKLSRAAVETLAIIAYHQPVTRAEVEDIRGVSLSKGTLDLLLEAGWVKPKGRKRVPGKPLMFGTTEEFLVHFGLGSLTDLPGVDELKAAGLLDPVDAAFANYGVREARDGDEESTAEEEALQLDLEELIEASLADEI